MTVSKGLTFYEHSGTFLKTRRTSSCPEFAINVFSVLILCNRSLETCPWEITPYLQFPPNITAWFY